MIVCKNCNHDNEDGATFCGNCGEYLEWVGERLVEPQPVSVTVAAGPDRPEAPTIVERIKDFVGLGEEGLTAETNEREMPAVIVLDDAPPTESLPDGPGPPHEQIGPKRPEQEKQTVRVRRRRATPRPGARPGDLICEQCGEPNNPSRRFCRQCGQSLAEAEIAAKPSWWRRIFTRERKPLPAGGRKQHVTTSGKPAMAKAGRLSVSQKIMRTLALVVMAGVIVIVAVPSYRSAVMARATDAYDNVRCLVVSCEEPIPILRASSKTDSPRHLAKLAVDREPNTYWAAAESADSGDNEWLCVDFAKKVNITQVGIYLGDPEGDPSEFEAQPHPSNVEIIFRGQPCTVHASLGTKSRLGLRPMNLEKTAEEQFRQVDFVGVRSVKVVVRDVHLGQEGGTTSLTLAEIEFWSKG